MLPPSACLGLAGYRSHRNQDATFVGFSQVKFTDPCPHDAIYLRLARTSENASRANFREFRLGEVHFRPSWCRMFCRFWESPAHVQKKPPAPQSTGGSQKRCCVLLRADHLLHLLGQRLLFLFFGSPPGVLFFSAASLLL